MTGAQQGTSVEFQDLDGSSHGVTGDVRWDRRRGREGMDHQEDKRGRQVERQSEAPCRSRPEERRRGRPCTHGGGKETGNCGATATTRRAADSQELLDKEERHRAARLYTTLQGVHGHPPQEVTTRTPRSAGSALSSYASDLKRNAGLSTLVKLARDVEQHDRQLQQGAPAHAAQRIRDTATTAITGEASGNGRQTSAVEMETRAEQHEEPAPIPWQGVHPTRQSAQGRSYPQDLCHKLRHPGD